MDLKNRKYVYVQQINTAQPYLDTIQCNALDSEVFRVFSEWKPVKTGISCLVGFSHHVAK